MFWPVALSLLADFRVSIRSGARCRPFSGPKPHKNTTEGHNLDRATYNSSPARYQFAVQINHRQMLYCAWLVTRWQRDRESAASPSGWCWGGGRLSENCYRETVLHFDTLCYMPALKKPVKPGSIAQMTATGQYSSLLTWFQAHISISKEGCGVLSPRSEDKWLVYFTQVFT